MAIPPGGPSSPIPGGYYVTVQAPRVRPIVTYVLLGITILIYVLQVITQSVMGTDLPAILGMKVNELILRGEVWRLITPVFLHGSLLHIAFNMYALNVLGPGLESSYGHGRFLALYFLSGFAGNVLSFLFSPAASLGSSTAVFGLIGAEGIFLYRNREIFGAQARRALGNVVFIAIANLLLGLSASGRIDNWGHIGGLLGGTFFAWFAGPLYRLVGEFTAPRLVDIQAGGRALTTGIVDLLVFMGLAAMRFWRGF